MPIKYLIITLSALFAALPAHALNKCTVNGQVTFQDAPCSGTAKAENVTVKPASGSTAAAPTPVPATFEQPADKALNTPDKYQKQTDDINKRLAKEDEERKARHAEYEKERTPETLANKCFDTARGDLLDSKGAYVVRWQHDDKSRYHKIKVEGRVKTRGGGFSEYYVYCNIDIDGKTMKKAYSGKNENLESIEWRF